MGITVLLIFLTVPRQALGAGEECVEGKNDYLEAYFAAGARTSRIAERLFPAASRSVAMCVMQEEGVSEELPKLFSSLLPPVQTLREDSWDRSFPLACVRAIMSRRLPPVPPPKTSAGKKPPRTVYGRCDGPSGNAEIEGVEPPCLSDNYINFTRRSYLDALRCIDVKPREMSAFIAHESGFQVNIGNTWGAWGTGQLTSVAVLDIDKHDRFKPFRGKPECASFASELAPKEVPDGRTKVDQCSRIHPPVNPASNFLYSALLYRGMKSQAVALARRTGVPAGVRDRVARALALYMYNGGPPAVEASFRSYMATYRGGDIEEGFRGHLLAHFGEGLGLFGGSREKLALKRREISGYVTGVQRSGSLANKDTGMKCSL